ncbi:MAG: SCO family protein [Ignavibacteriaceae bacterium]|nr:SCO family protein [Ignavibacteriaceae bacterium]
MIRQRGNIILMKSWLTASLLILSAFNLLPADEKKIEVGIDEQLGKTIPLNLTFTDENNHRVQLKELITKPTVFAFVYYNCPAICTPLMIELADVTNKSDLMPGEDYNIITLSMDEHEISADAIKKKDDIIIGSELEYSGSSWTFLTGDSASVKQLADAVGFYFERKGDQFIHTGALIFIDKSGKITRYLFPGYNSKYGFSILPFDFKMAINETAQGKAVPTISRVLQYCFSYDPEGKTYVLSVTRIFGAFTLILAVIFLVYLTVSKKKKNLNSHLKV